MKKILIVKLPVKHPHAGRLGLVGGSLPGSSAGITDKDTAKLYCDHHFGAGKPMEFTVNFKGAHKINVTFDSIHLYTKTVPGGPRRFDLLRAQSVDNVLEVLRQPDSVIWSHTNPKNKQYDKLLDIESALYGRLILEPKPTPLDIKELKCTNFEFISWHLPTEAQFDAAQRSLSKTTPVKMRKALDGAFLNASAGTAALFQIESASSGISAVWLLDHSTTNRRNAFEGIANTPESAASVNESTYLGKAIRDTHESNLWLPMDSPYLADLVEAFTLQGQTNIQSFSDALASWLAMHGQPQKKNALPAPLMPAVPVHWTQPELDAWSVYLHAKPQVLWSPEDWSMLVEWLLQQYWSPAWASSMANWLAVKSTLLGQIEAGLAANPPSAAVASLLAAALPVELAAVVELGLPVSVLTEAMINFARVKCATLIVDMGERLRSGVREVVLEHQKAVMLGGKLENLQQKLFDKFATANRDWRRIAVTEVSENAAQGAVCAAAPGDKMKRLEMYKGVCAWCHHINGRIVTVVAADKKNKDGFNEIWPGKTNVGRSSAPKKRLDGKLYDREPDEMWWIASGAQHPNCFVNSGVPIYTSEGYKAIGEIKIGDMVLTHKGRFKPVNWVSDRQKYTGDLVHALVSFDGKNKKHLPLTTPEHPFLTNRGWVNAGDLIAGDVIRALAKECPTCRSKFVNLRHKDVIYCRNACIPKSGINQFSTSDQDVLRVEKLKTSAGNSARMAGMTVEQRRMLTAQMIARRAMNHSGEYAFVDVLVEEVVWSKSNPKTHLWNFGVEDDESYVAAGVVVHNCRGRWLPLGKSDPDKLAKFMAGMAALKAAREAQS